MNDILCKDVCLLLPLYIDNMLSDEEMTQVREHLAECSSCQNEYELLKGVIQQTKNLKQLEVSASFTEKLHQGLEEAAVHMEESEEFLEETPVRKGGRLRIVPVAVACAAAIAVSLFALNRLPDTNQFIMNSAAPTIWPMNQSAESLEDDGEAEKEDTQLPEEVVETPKAYETSTPRENNLNQVEQHSQSSSEDRAVDTREDISHSSPHVDEQSARLRFSGEAYSENQSMGEGKRAEDSSANANEESSIVSSGSGGVSSSSEKAAVTYVEHGSKISTTATFYFEPYALEEAQKRMSGIAMSDGKYVISGSLLNVYADILRQVDGYVSSSSVKHDYTSEYNRLLADKASGTERAEEKIKEIDEAVSQCYIVLEEK